MTTQVLREEWTKAERKAAGVADDDADQLRPGYTFAWVAGIMFINLVLFGYWLGGLVFLAALVQVALVAVAVYGVIKIYRDWQADRASWAARRAYLNRHSGQLYNRHSGHL